MPAHSKSRIDQCGLLTCQRRAEEIQALLQKHGHVQRIARRTGTVSRVAARAANMRHCPVCAVESDAVRRVRRHANSSLCAAAHGRSRNRHSIVEPDRPAASFVFLELGNCLRRAKESLRPVRTSQG